MFVGTRSMRLCAALLVLGILACAPAQAPPAAAPRAAAPTGPEPSAAASPAGATAATPAWQAEWDRTLAAARQEGKVEVWGPPGDLIRKSVSEGFRQAFPDIAIEWVGGRSTEHATKIEGQRRAGVYAADVVIGGTSTAAMQLGPQGALDPIKPILMLPEVTDPRSWYDGRIEFADDEGQYNVAFVYMSYPFIGYDPHQVQPADIANLYQLLDPKWKGKIVINDPRVPGAGQSFYRWLWHTLGPEKGEEFIVALRAQAGAVDRDQRRLMEWIARGRYAILIGPSSGATMTELFDAGLTFGLQNEFQDYGGYITASFGSLMLINQAPHPNAAKVFVNWFLSRDGQTAYSTAMTEPSRRTDVPRDHIPAYAIPRPDGKYWPSYLARDAATPPEMERVFRTVFQ
jgi:iron(III) transport system substrate-binding protein